MEFNMKQWRNETDEEEEEPCMKQPKLVLNSQYYPPQPDELPLFVPDHTTTTTNMSLNSSDHSTNRIGSYFSLGQWQELELQALIYRHMISGATVPPELIHLVNKSPINTTSSPYYLSHSNSLQYQYYPHYQPALVQSGYWGRGAMDPEPGRCRRTDGKKWRCSRDVVAGQKYCERHVHRGRNRSRKPVETPTSTTTSTTTQGGGGVPRFTVSGPSPSMDLLHFSRRASDSIIQTKGTFGAPNDSQPEGSRTLRHFIDDWPRSLHETTDSTTNLSISMPGNPSSDFSLKLGTGDADESSAQVGRGESERPELNWGATWDTNSMAPIGGPLAEALRSSMTNSSPTSVLHVMPRGQASETSFVSS